MDKTSHLDQYLHMSTCTRINLINNYKEIANMHPTVT